MGYKSFEENKERYLVRAQGYNRKWHTGFLVAVYDEKYCTIQNLAAQHTIVQWECLLETLCPCSGLRDIKNTLIFAEDIIRDENGNSGIVQYGEFVHNNGKILGWYVEWISENADSFRQDLLYWQQKRKIEVIGNTADDKDILSDITGGAQK